MVTETIRWHHKNLGLEMRFGSCIFRSDEFMEITFNEAKRLKILRERGLDIAESGLLFEDEYVEIEDDRKDYGERRFRVWGFLHG